MARIPETDMNRLVITYAVAGLSICTALLMAQTPPAGRGNAGATREGHLTVDDETFGDGAH